jgi:hypothetical protein
METSGFFSLTPEQITGLEAGGGVLHGQDPVTRRKYLLIEQIEPTISGEYIRERIQEGLADIDTGDVSEWNAEQFKNQLLNRHPSR